MIAKTSGRCCRKPAGHFDWLVTADTSAATAFHALSQGGQVTMPLAPTFWAKSFGMVTDRFGISWAVNGEPIEFS